MKSLRNELISVLDSSAFPSLSMIYDGITNFPGRIYANKDLMVAFLISELNLDQSIDRLGPISWLVRSLAY